MPHPGADPTASGHRPRHLAQHAARAAAVIAVVLVLRSSVRAEAPPADEPPASTDDPDASPSDSTRDVPYWRTNLFRRVFSDQPYLVKTWWPQEFEHPGFSAPLAIALAVAATSESRSRPGADLTVSHDVTGDATPSSNRVSHYFTRIGNGAPLIVALGTSYLFARHAGNDRLAETASLSTEALADAGIWIVALKRAFARMRPNQPGEGQFFQYGRPNAGSFPSGHAMASFSVAAVFADTYGDKRWVPWVAYGGASLVAASRLALGRHFASDLLAGAVLGNSIGHMVTARSEEAGDRPRGWRSRIVPEVGPDGRGAGLGVDLSR